VAEINPDGESARSVYRVHHGNADECLQDVLGEFDLSRIAGVAATAATPESVRAAGRLDDRVAVLAAARRYYPEARSILIIGAEKFGLIQLDRQGNYHAFPASTGCAAGTGSFLDQQALRPKLDGAAALSALARNNTGALPALV
jgi:activator of 2-hydroxyglutaryl-CoA dehydratase